MGQPTPEELAELMSDDIRENNGMSLGVDIGSQSDYSAVAVVEDIARDMVQAAGRDSRKLKATLSMDAALDLKLMHNIDIRTLGESLTTGFRGETTGSSGEAKVLSQVYRRALRDLYLMKYNGSAPVYSPAQADRRRVTKSPKPVIKESKNRPINTLGKRKLDI